LQEIKISSQYYNLCDQINQCRWFNFCCVWRLANTVFIVSLCYSMKYDTFSHFPSRALCTLTMCFKPWMLTGVIIVERYGSWDLWRSRTMSRVRQRSNYIPLTDKRNWPDVTILNCTLWC
jgi:hypothetical protein